MKVHFIEDRVMNETQLIDYIVRYCRHELSESEYSEFSSWLEVEANRHQFEEYLKLYRKGRKAGCWDAMDERDAWKRIEEKISRKQSVKSPRIKSWWRYAAVVACVLGIGLAFYRLSVDEAADEYQVTAQVAPGSRKAVLHLSDGHAVALGKDASGVLTEKNGVRINYAEGASLMYETTESAGGEMVYNKIVVPRGGEYSLILADGSEVYLNAESELIYPVAFKGKERKVTLKGEAFFKVKKDRKHPFIVQSDYNRIEVVGTQFNVSTYHANCIKTTLLEGAVKVSNDRETQLLKPGEQAICSTDNLEVKNVDARQVAGWVQGVFEFENMNLKEISEQLGRWYDVEFVFETPEAEKALFTGAVTRYRNLEFVLNILKELSELHFISEGKLVKVVGRK